MEEQVIAKAKFIRIRIFAIFFFIEAILCLIYAVSIPAFFRGERFLTIAIAALFVFIFAIGMYLIARSLYRKPIKRELTITNHRIYGKTGFGRHIELPMDAISSVGTSLLKGFIIASSSGTIRFLLVKNNSQLYDCISKLLIDRQCNQKTHIPEQPLPVTTSTLANNLREYKQLLDEGILTQEEFDAKKKQLLEL